MSSHEPEDRAVQGTADDATAIVAAAAALLVATVGTAANLEELTEHLAGEIDFLTSVQRKNPGPGLVDDALAVHHSLRRLVDAVLAHRLLAEQGQQSTRKR